MARNGDQRRQLIIETQHRQSASASSTSKKIVASKDAAIIYNGDETPGVVWQYIGGIMARGA